jgi:hypothetical protein
MHDHVYHRWTAILLAIAVLLLVARCSTERVESPGSGEIFVPHLTQRSLL